jgi:sensor c-di-GMP phosphodiesterase-like protein
MAHALGLRIVCEGVETVAQLCALRTAGCEILQGYLFARPLPVDEAALWLHESRVPEHVLKTMCGCVEDLSRIPAAQAALSA